MECLPYELKTCTVLIAFKNQLKTYLFKHSFVLLHLGYHLFPCIFIIIVLLLLLLLLLLLVTVEPTGNSEKSVPQMGFEPTTLHDLVGCSNH